MDLVLRAVVVFFFLLVLTRVIGKRELSSLQPFDLILLIILGDAVQQGLTQDDYSLTGAVLVVGTIAVLQVFVSWLSYRYKRLRPVLEGEPIIVLQDGKPIERNLKRERLTVEEIAEEARKQSIAHLEQIRFAVLETSGQISFIKKSA
ncbi:MAG: YetF domain-containing protein [Gaiellaceae bacterium]